MPSLYIMVPHPLLIVGTTPLYFGCLRVKPLIMVPHPLLIVGTKLWFLVVWESRVKASVLIDALDAWEHIIFNLISYIIILSRQHIISDLEVMVTHPLLWGSNHGFEVLILSKCPSPWLVPRQRKRLFTEWYFGCLKIYKSWNGDIVLRGTLRLLCHYSMP